MEPDHWGLLLHIGVNTIEQMNEGLQARLKRLGVVKGARHLKSPEQSPRTSPDELLPLETLLPGGSEALGKEGGCFVVDRVYPLDTLHGVEPLASLPSTDLSMAAPFAKDDRLGGQNLREFVFLDTETTGLAGAGTLAFMVGVAYMEQRASLDGGASDEVFVVRQYFLRDPGDELPMLGMLDELIRKAGLVTFNLAVPLTCPCWICVTR
ncbi:MAG: ribonuclease H-like domain-containing protein [Chloroflexota bacterium]